jgi:hypothetical protein
MLHARRPRAVFAALALSALALSSAPVASPAAPSSHPTTKPAAAKSPLAKPAATAKTAAHGKPGAKSVAAKTKPKPAAKPLFSYKDAPADEYFGRLKMSILGVRSKVKDLGLDADSHPEHDAAILSTALWVEDAMRDWSKKYPYDHWLPRYAYALETIYERIPGTEAAKRARRQLNYITAFFPQTVYGKVGRAKLVDGIPTPDPSAAPATELERLALIDGKVRPTIPPLAAAPTPSPASIPAMPTAVMPNTVPNPAMPNAVSTLPPAPTNGPSLLTAPASTTPATSTVPATAAPLSPFNAPASSEAPSTLATPAPTTTTRPATPKR